MPRLSVIIPHQSDDVALECTILSVLENRPHDSEIIVVHNGSYSDPYQLQDELTIVSEESLSALGLLNAGLWVARSPVVCVLSSGARVKHECWADAPMRMLQQSRRLVAVATGLQTPKSYSLGVTLDRLSHPPINGRLAVDATDSNHVHAPHLACGFYRRNTLRAIGGWNETASWSNADIELAMLMQELDLECGCTTGDDSCVESSQHQSITAVDVAQLAEFSKAYGLSNQGILMTVLEIARGCCSGNLGASIAWVRGMHRDSEKARIASRVEKAQKQLQSLPDASSSNASPVLMTGRRAA